MNEADEIKHRLFYLSQMQQEINWSVSRLKVIHDELKNGIPEVGAPDSGCHKDTGANVWPDVAGVQDGSISPSGQ